jgi:ATP-dependent Clp protease ATP-binding subunit ClpA
MFQRFTGTARAVVCNARDHAAKENATEIREEHLLAALLSAPRVGPLLAQLGVNVAGDPPVLAEIRDARRRGGLSAVDAEALSGLGIDLDAVVSRLETQLGNRVLDDSRRRQRRRRSRLVFSTGSKLTLQAGLHQAVARGDRELREEHLLLGLLARRGLVADALGVRGVTTATVLAALDTGGTAQNRAS